ncbi:MAG: hypothetical protein L0Z49_07175 [Actinobacteria bacterium]|nr:hypothetical protein [Actinomycetota bacterium]MCI0678525.1 hypothetical protein [Actinomycetota bacterium]
MADVDLTVEKIDRDGLAATYTAINATDTYFAPRKDGRLILHFKNTGGSGATITFDITQTQDGVSYADPTVTVPATTGDIFVGGLGAVYEVASGDDRGKVKFTNNQATGVTVAALEV